MSTTKNVVAVKAKRAEKRKPVSELVIHHAMDSYWIGILAYPVEARIAMEKLVRNDAYWLNVAKINAHKKVSCDASNRMLNTLKG